MDHRDVTARTSERFKANRWRRSVRNAREKLEIPRLPSEKGRSYSGNGSGIL
jgi:hypothetical protein